MRKNDGKISAVVWIVLTVVLFLLLRFTCSRIFRGPDVQFVDRGSASAKELKTPLRGSVLIQKGKKRDYLYLYMKLTDAAGREIRTLNTPNGKPPAPKVEIYSEQGDKVYSCTLEYG